MNDSETEASQETGVGILIAENNQSLARQLRLWLEQKGYRVTLAINGTEAMAMALENQPDLIIGALDLPATDGYQFCRAVKNNQRLNGVPFILLTAFTDAKDILAIMECGADNFIRKPCRHGYLMSLVEDLLRRADEAAATNELGRIEQSPVANAEPRQLLAQLLSSFEQAVQLNSELKRRSDELAKCKQVQNGLNRLAEELNQATSELQVAEIALQRSVEILAAEAGRMALSYDGGKLRTVARYKPAVQLPIADAVEHRRANDSGSDKADNGETYSLSVPLLVAGRKLGVMNLLLRENETRRERNLKIASRIAEQTAPALERTKLHERLRQLVKESTGELAAEVKKRKYVQAELAHVVAVVEATPDLVATMMPDSRVRYLNQAGLRFVGRPQGDQRSNFFLVDRYPPKEGKKILETAIPHAVSHGVWSGETTILDHENREIPFLQMIIAHKNRQGTLSYLSTIARDITPLKRHESRLFRLNRIHGMLSAINRRIVRIRNKKELFAEACRLAVELGRFKFAWIGMFNNARHAVIPVAKAGQDCLLPDCIDLNAACRDAGICSLLTDAIAKTTPAVCNNVASDWALRCQHGQGAGSLYRSIAVVPLNSDKQPVCLFVVYATETDVFDKEVINLLLEAAGDISYALDHLKKEESLNYLAYFNAVTGLANRSLFLDRLTQFIDVARRNNEKIAVIVLDIERFSDINQSFGRRPGDQLLRQIARQLATLVSDALVLAHLSDDDFAVAVRLKLPDRELGRTMDLVLSGIQEHPFILDGQNVRVSLKGGVAIYPDGGKNPETLLRNAETALTKSKQTGDNYALYRPEIDLFVVEKTTLAIKLREALRREQFVLHYQPKVELANGKICGLEALIRWKDPEHGLLPPNEFIPMLEETGMIIEAGMWAVQQAITDSLAWQRKGLAPPKIAVNVSPLQLHQHDFVQMLRKTVNGHRFIELEIAENLIMQDIEVNLRKLNTLRAMDIEIAIDDFGTGYSSLSYLAKLPVNALKIDRGFIANMTDNSEDMSVVSTIISLAHSLNMRVIAEGVEKDEQHNVLRMLNCNEMQGFLFSPAVSAEKIEKLLER